MGFQQVIVFDVETTGTDRRRDQIIELCVQYGLDDQARHQQWRIRPDTPIHPDAQAVHGISMEDLRDCPRFAEVADDIRAVFTPAQVLIGYNIGFDISMLQAEFARLDQMLDLRAKSVVDPFRLWQQCEPRSLMHAHQRFVGDSFEQAHSAAADVAATGRVLRGMIESFSLVDRDWDTLAEVCEPERTTWVGSSRHLRWSKDGRAVFSFGKHKGQPVDGLVHSEDEGYLRWVISSDFPPHVRQICARALELPNEAFLAWMRATYGPSVVEIPSPANSHPVAAVATGPAEYAAADTESAVEIPATELAAQQLVTVPTEPATNWAVASAVEPTVEPGEMLSAQGFTEPGEMPTAQGFTEPSETPSAGTNMLLPVIETAPAPVGELASKARYSADPKPLKGRRKRSSVAKQSATPRTPPGDKQGHTGTLPLPFDWP